MERIDLCRMNIAAELVMCAVLLLLLFTCLVQRKRLAMNKPLIFLISIDLALMLIQVAGWGMTVAAYDRGAQAALELFPWRKLIYTADFSLYYFLSVAYYNYISAHILDVSMQRGTAAEEASNRWTKGLLIWGVVITCAFAAGINCSYFYWLDANGEENYRLWAQAVIDLMAMAGPVVSAAALIKNRKALGKVNFRLLLFYIITPGLFVLHDLVHYTCVNYLAAAFYVIILYIHVDLRENEILAEKERHLALQEKELSELNTQIMLSQMQPHFLYNTLTTVSSLCYIEGAEKAKEVVDRFSDYFRANLDSLGKEKYISFEKELQHIENYLWLESVRFEDSLHVAYDIQVSDFRLPSLSIQPLVENAVKHGIRGKKGGGTVMIKTQETEKEYLVIVAEDGAGYEVGTLPDDNRSHVGIENIRKRLALLCDGSCEIQSEAGKGTTATVHIPKGMKPCE